MRKGTVWISEDEQSGDDGWHLLGTFSARHDTGGSTPREKIHSLPIDAALAWARERADRVVVVLEPDRYSAGREPLPAYPSWPPDDLPELVRRRLPGTEWLDRTEADEPIRWAVVVWVSLVDDAVPERARWDGEVAAFAERSGADGWDTESLDACLADMERALRRAGPDREVGWFSYGNPAYRVRLMEHAPTRAAALAQARERCVAPDGTKLAFEVVPAQ